MKQFIEKTNDYLPYILVFIFTFPISLAIVIGLLIAGDWDDY